MSDVILNEDGAWNTWNQQLTINFGFNLWIIVRCDILKCIDRQKNAIQLRQPSIACVTCAIAANEKNNNGANVLVQSKWWGNNSSPTSQLAFPSPVLNKKRQIAVFLALIYVLYSKRKSFLFLFETLFFFYFDFFLFLSHLYYYNKLFLEQKYFKQQQKGVNKRVFRVRRIREILNLFAIAWR